MSQTLQGGRPRSKEQVRGVVARVLLVTAVVLGVVRVLLAQYRHADFVQAYGEFRHLDMTTFLGQEIAKREVPGHVDSAIFSLLCAGLLILPLLRKVVGGQPWARFVALALSAAGGLNTLGSVAVPSPWWYHLLTLVMVAMTAVVVWLLWRAPVEYDYLAR
ncbi:hypothetical protein [Angustibacter sp. Root456]|uniref:hypothetical protein n=1 Tax=Angustibacter sp. Root456 TaxID=1736539 RepID=UPI0006FB83E1|nr:hypothetical protein [Angustibacter sp. Root456]KQX66027.1 hypothetical protein ASD06_06425 [Angustibacter sp. Root456]